MRDFVFVPVFAILFVLACNFGLLILFGYCISSSWYHGLAVLLTYPGSY